MSRLKEFQSLVKNVESFSDRQVEILMDDIDFDQPLENFSINIKPNSGPYRGGQFKFSITCDSQLLAQCQTLPVRKLRTPVNGCSLCAIVIIRESKESARCE